MNEHREILRRAATVSVLALAVTSLSAAVALGSARGADQFPTTGPEAMALYESEDRPEEWADGPVQYIMLEDEAGIWKELRDDDRRIDFIDWFWTRRDDDTRDARHPFKEGFYRRVAEANQRFPGLPRGWKSDRGRVWIVLGTPNNIRRSGGLDVWTYNAYGSELAAYSFQGELQVAFQQVGPARYDIAGGIGPGAWPEYVIRVIQHVNRAAIEDPFLEFRGGR